jgi:TonB family protein
MHKRSPAHLLLVLAIAVLMLGAVNLRAQSKHKPLPCTWGTPVQYDRLVQVLEAKGGIKTIIGIIESCGVDFELNAERSQRLWDLGATKELFDAITKDRSTPGWDGAEKSYACKPAAYNKLKDVLRQRSMTDQGIIDYIKKCGVNFEITEDNAKELSKLGASQELLEIILENPNLNWDPAGHSAENSDAPVSGDIAKVRPDGPVGDMSNVISGGVLNSRAISLSQPVYPPAARAVHAAGVCSVQVVVNETGNVMSASAVSCHPLLKSAAEAAARNATFSPTLLSGQPRKVSGVITYTFTP